MHPSDLDLPLLDCMPAAPGQELLWQRTWRRFGLTDDEILTHFGGPAFLAWTRMGNIHSYMGPLPQSFVCDQAGRSKQVPSPHRRKIDRRLVVLLYVRH